MPLDVAKVQAGLSDVMLTTATHLCGPEAGSFEAAAKAGRPVTVCCTQEAQRFREIADDAGLSAPLSFVNVRETAGWSAEAKATGPKMAALIAAAAVEMPTPAGVALESNGIALILGRGQVAVDAARQLEDRLDITVLLSTVEGIVPPARTTFPIAIGRVRNAKGHLGAFELVVDGFSAPKPSSRSVLKPAGPGKNGAVSKADIVIDLTGGPPLFPGPDMRDGYLRADPDDPTAVQRALFKAADMVGTFDKPRYVSFTPGLCAHSRSRITGCQRCLDLCPAGAISPAGDHVAIDPYVCGGCGQCASACPTGAASYAIPSVDILLRRVREAVQAYRLASGGAAPRILFHDQDHGRDLIDISSRYASGLPADVIPLAVNETGQIGLEAIASAFAYGVSGVAILTRAKPKHGITGIEQTLDLANTLLTALGYGNGAAYLIAADDPDDLAAALRDNKLATPTVKPSTFMPLGGKRDVLKLALRELQRAARFPIDTVALPKGAPFGRVQVQTDGCTLCLACVAACPTSALSAADDKPLLRFDESLCVQCGLCQATCPERVVSLEPRLSFAAFEAEPEVLKQEEPYPCVSCGKPFGVKSTIEKVAAKLGQSHWMFQGAGASRLDLIRMCEDCRISVSMNEKIDPYAGPDRPRLRTSEDYFREREDAAAREKAMLDRIEKGDA
ncbi:MAG: 4Fe-4S binding protein [Hyphomicrobiaceae bacterium]|nr:4Fe-4S binding protein [Hyphomicrobiaceae bacterium]